MFSRGQRRRRRPSPAQSGGLARALPVRERGRHFVGSGRGDGQTRDGEAGAQHAREQEVASHARLDSTLQFEPPIVTGASRGLVLASPIASPSTTPCAWPWSHEMAPRSRLRLRRYEPPERGRGHHRRCRRQARDSPHRRNRRGHARRHRRAGQQREHARAHALASAARQRVRGLRRGARDQPARAFRLSKVVLGSMVLRGRGVVVNISSDAALEPYPTGVCTARPRLRCSICRASGRPSWRAPACGCSASIRARWTRRCTPRRCPRPIARRSPIQRGRPTDRGDDRRARTKRGAAMSPPHIRPSCARWSSAARRRGASRAT